MPDFRLHTALLTLLGCASSPLCAQQPVQSPHDLIRDVVYNELHDREHDSHWQYRSECVTPEKSLVREQVETEQGPVFRILERDGRPLDAAHQREEDRRLASYLHDSSQMERVRREHEEDEQRLASDVALLPQAFLFEYQPGSSGDEVLLSFRPNPAFVPSGYEARIIHALAGTVVIDGRHKRLIEMHGTLSERVDFGFGVLGHVEKGGTFEIHRRQVSPEHWKTDLVDVHVEGKLLLFHAVGKQQREARSDFRSVPAGITVAAAEAMLNRAAPQQGTTQAELAPAE